MSLHSRPVSLQCRLGSLSRSDSKPIEAHRRRVRVHLLQGGRCLQVGNQLTGTLPAYIFLGNNSNPKLQIFDVSRNQLQGSLPLDYLAGKQWWFHSRSVIWAVVQECIRTGVAFSPSCRVVCKQNFGSKFDCIPESKICAKHLLRYNYSPAKEYSWKVCILDLSVEIMESSTKHSWGSSPLQTCYPTLLCRHRAQIFCSRPQQNVRWGAWIVAYSASPQYLHSNRFPGGLSLNVITWHFAEASSEIVKSHSNMWYSSRLWMLIFSAGEILSDTTAAILHSTKGYLSTTVSLDCELSLDKRRISAIVAWHHNHCH